MYRWSTNPLSPAFCENEGEEDSPRTIERDLLDQFKAPEGVVPWKSSTLFALVANPIWNLTPALPPVFKLRFQDVSMRRKPLQWKK